MWTLNSENTLPFALQSIDKAIPDAVVNQKIIVDGGSTDKTKEIAERFDWDFFVSDKQTIGHQANLALSKVETDFFASFEHDVVLNPKWLALVLKHFKKESVVVAQGTRIASSPEIRIIEGYGIFRQLDVSIDNNMYKTDVIKDLGGFNDDYSSSCDRELQDRVFKCGLKWVVDPTIVSLHIKGNILSYCRNGLKLSSNDLYYNKSTNPFPLFLKFFLSPFRGLQLALSKNCPKIAVYYPFWRAYNLKSLIKLNAKK